MDPGSEFGSLGHAESFLVYFANHAEHEPLFIPEHEVASKIIAVMREAGPTDCPDVRIRGLVESLEARKHYNGSGWHGFKNAVRAWIQGRGGQL